MTTSIETKLRTAAAATPALTAYLGTSPFRWYDMQQSQGSALPSVVVLLVSAVDTYSTTARLATSLNRVQFTIWDTDPEEARAIEQALIAFLETFNAFSPVPGAAIQPNRVVMRRQSGQPQTEPLIFWRLVDAMIYNNENS